MFGLILEVPHALAGALHYQAYVVLPFIGLLVAYHLASARRLPESWVLDLKPLPAVAFYVFGWLMIEVLYLGEINFIYFAF